MILWDDVVIVGGGFGGLLAAHVLLPHAGRVTVVDQDLLEAGTLYRRGAPQARHPHGLMARGTEITERFFPGLRAELAGQGAPIYDMGAGAEVLYPTGWAPRENIGLPVQTFTRAALETAIRQRVMANPRVVVAGGRRAHGLVWNQAGDVAGVLVHSRAMDDGDGVAAPAGQTELIRGDLVVAADGRGSQLASWLKEAGYGAVTQRVVEGNLSYTSRLYHSPGRVDDDLFMSVELTYAPTVRRGGALMQVEGGLQLVTMVGANGEQTPTDEAGFLAYARSLRNQNIVDSIHGAEPADRIYRIVRLRNRWNRYDSLPHWPRNLLCLGDAVCSLNPVYGQGLTMAAIHAEILESLLLSQADDRRLSSLFQRRVASSLQVPWMMATSSDQAWTPDAVPRSVRMGHRYIGQLLELLPHDADLYRRFMLVSQMVASPTSLFTPQLLAQVVRRGMRLGAFNGISCPVATKRTE